jgi:hypothetical protein
LLTQVGRSERGIQFGYWSSQHSGQTCLLLNAKTMCTLLLKVQTLHISLPEVVSVPGTDLGSRSPKKIKHLGMPYMDSHLTPANAVPPTLTRTLKCISQSWITNPLVADSPIVWYLQNLYWEGLCAFVREHPVPGVCRAPFE